ncbi:MAG: site-specific integrase, partial [Chitinophagaceae bacterium]|nr:site-specific integrase [Chitinophagaceae bacterium]
MLHLHYEQQVLNFLDYLKFEKRYSQHTVISYETDLVQFFTFLEKEFEAPLLPNISSPIVRTWLATLKENNTAAKTIHRKASALKSFFRYLLRKKIVEQS